MSLSLRTENRDLDAEVADKKAENGFLAMADRQGLE